MNASTVNVSVQIVDGSAAVLGVRGDLTGSAERELLDACALAYEHGIRVIILDLSGMEYMNSSGIGLLITLLLRARRQGSRLLAVGLSEYYRKIFELTRLSEAFETYPSQAEALAALGASSIRTEAA